MLAAFAVNDDQDWKPKSFIKLGLFLLIIWRCGVFNGRF
jgi:hypothetical protein